MPTVSFTPHLLKHHACATTEVEAGTVGGALQAVFMRRPELQGYILDDQGRVRQHVLILVDDKPIRDRDQLTDPVVQTSKIYILQALSGG